MIKTFKYWVEPSITGYTPKTTYWDQFTHAESQETEKEAVKVIKALYKMLLVEAKPNVKHFTELVMVLNHKCWAHARVSQNLVGKAYSDLYQKAWDLGLNHYKDEELNYLIETLD